MVNLPRSRSDPPGSTIIRRSPIAYLASILVPLLGIQSPAWAGIVFAVLEDQQWTLYVQAESGSPPQAISMPGGMDASAPAISPDGVTIAFESPGHGVLICSRQGGSGESGCKTVNSPNASAVRTSSASTFR